MLDCGELILTVCSDGFFPGHNSSRLAELARQCGLRLICFRLQWNWRGPIVWGQLHSSFGNPARLRKSFQGEALPSMSTVDKIAGLKEILALDPKNSFARYGIAVELASRGEVDAAMAEFDKLLTIDPDYTAGYFMAAQTLSKHGRTGEAITRLKAGISCAARTDNRHALSEMQNMLDELDR
jgi:tetratricopeptide (TPR) repeat protein